jgi:hypothetical protein
MDASLPDILRFHRSMTRPFFTRDKISHFDIFDQHAQDIVHQIKNRLREEIAVDIQARLVIRPKLFISHATRYLGCSVQVYS